MVRFIDRADAGKQLAHALETYKGLDAVVLGLVRGGVVTASVVAQQLQLPLDFISVRKLGAPESEELAIGAVDETGHVVLNKELVDMMRVSKTYIATVAQREKNECLQRIQRYRKHYPEVVLKNKIALLVDDGIATGSTMEAAINVARAKGAKKIVVVVPVLPEDVVTHFKRLADDLVFLVAPRDFGSVGFFYDHFPQITHEEVIQLLKDSKSVR